MPPLITVFYIQPCWEAPVTVQRCICVRCKWKGVYFIWFQEGRCNEGEPGALGIRQTDLWVGGQSSSSSLQTMESSSESNWALGDIGLRSVGCAVKLSCHAPPSQLHLSSGLSSHCLSRTSCHLGLMHLLLIVAHMMTVPAVFICAVSVHTKDGGTVFLGMRTGSDIAPSAIHRDSANTRYTLIHPQTLPQPVLLPPVLPSTQPPPSLHPFTRTSAPPA